MVTYKQEKKEEARSRIWKKAIEGLTIKRQQSAILSEIKIREMRRYLHQKSEYTAGIFDKDESVINGFSDFLNQVNSEKKASELKVIYFCGPEPENDLNVMLDYGIKIENVWALEQDRTMYGEAVNKAREKYPTLKVYRQKFKDFCENFPKHRFDIIFLDFTQSLFSVDNASTIHYVFDYGMLSDIGVLITNNAVPSLEDKTKKEDDYLQILSSFLAKQEKPESAILGRFGKYEILSSECLDNNECLKPYLKENFDGAYSAFCTTYPIFYANNVAPSYRIFKNNSISSQIFKNNNQINDVENDELGNYFVQNLTHSWKEKGAMYDSKEAGTIRNRTESLRIWYDLLKTSEKLNNVNLTGNFKSSIEKTYKFIEEFDYYFCDLTFIKVLIQFVLNQLGYPMHVNYLEHDRFSYKAKDTVMNVDIFTFDSCRAIYDWFPLFELFENNIQINEKQIIFRCCIDLISGKQGTWSPIGNYITPCNALAINEDGIEMEYFEGFDTREVL
ncbi:hypothetical protein D8867_07930 [Streptococcus salivarius]|jgi:hypothetical protein|uniref:Class I SAM-dependent methyltransferase n=1 Tax=Streptococcus salivarius TaxID=1304 RepID=A0AAX1YA91_STRSL|nr:hypothetical protein [Streptococcus salivarius]MBW4820680.1 hypothetical protein [Streptococcus salivarius]RGW73244.1 hypothetical protein DWV54_05490 [Streptococcus salivarius]RSI55769.1 hypothetical protein D8867_07930 [Streptococcus salivarius]VTY29451.1 Uncharacterised protein [Streptococcus salivarius]